jgi:hypothetical protein
MQLRIPKRLPIRSITAISVAVLSMTMVVGELYAAEMSRPVSELHNRATQVAQSRCEASFATPLCSAAVDGALFTPCSDSKSLLQVHDVGFGPRRGSADFADFMAYARGVLPLNPSCTPRASLPGWVTSASRWIQQQVWGALVSIAMAAAADPTVQLPPTPPPIEIIEEDDGEGPNTDVENSISGWLDWIGTVGFPLPPPPPVPTCLETPMGPICIPIPPPPTSI